MAACGPSPCPGGCGQKLSATEIGLAAFLARPSATTRQLGTAIAIALAESMGGWTGAGNTYTDPSGKLQHVYGLWQISTVHGTGTSVCDTAIAAQQMWAISKGGTDWRAWTTYTRGTYLPYMPAALAAAAKVRSATPGALGGAAQTVPSGGARDCLGAAAVLGPLGILLCKAQVSLTDVYHALVFALAFVTSPNTWVRLGEVVAGAVLVLVAIWLIFAETRIGSAVESAGRKLVTA